MKKWLLLGGALLSGTAALADDTSLAAKFGALESVQYMSISPDGDHIAYIAPAPGGGQLLVVVDLTGDAVPKPILQESNVAQTLRRCDWASDSRLICNVTLVHNEGGDISGFSRLFSIASDGKDLKELSARTNVRSLYRLYGGGQVLDWDVPNRPGKVLLTRFYVPQQSIGTNVRHDEEGLGVEEVDTASLVRRPVEKPRPEAIEYISDGHGEVRVMGTMPRDPDGYLRTSVIYNYRKPGSREWERLSKIDLNANGLWRGFEPVAIDRATNVAYGFDDNGGTKALYNIALNGSGARQLVLSRPDVDIDEVIAIGRDRRVVGASFATERRSTAFFDPQLKTLAAALSKALPGKPGISFVDSDAGENKLVLFASSDTDPGTFYRYDKATRKLAQLLPVRSQLAGLTMGEMKPISFPAADGTIIPGYLTLPPGHSGKGLPAIVLPHGGPGARDEWGFDWLAQYFAVRGFAVIQPNFRGSSGYGSAWYRKNGFQSWRTAIGDVNDAGRWLVAQGIAAPGKLAIFGWSYGGYAALQSSVLDPQLFKAIVAVAPVTDLDKLRNDSLYAANRVLVERFIGQGPHVREGSPAQNAGRIQAPVLLFHGDRDQNVPILQSRYMADKLRDAGREVRLIEFPKLDHQLADAAARTKMLAESDAFIRKALGLPPG